MKEGGEDRAAYRRAPGEGDKERGIYNPQFNEHVQDVQSIVAEALPGYFGWSRTSRNFDSLDPKIRFFYNKIRNRQKC